MPKGRVTVVAGGGGGGGLRTRLVRRAAALLLLPLLSLLLLSFCAPLGGVDDSTGDDSPFEDMAGDGTPSGCGFGSWRLAATGPRAAFCAGGGGGGRMFLRRCHWSMLPCGGSITLSMKCIWISCSKDTVRALPDETLPGVHAVSSLCSICLQWVNPGSHGGVWCGDLPGIGPPAVYHPERWRSCR